MKKLDDDDSNTPAPPRYPAPDMQKLAVMAFEPETPAILQMVLLDEVLPAADLVDHYCNVLTSGNAVCLYKEPTARRYKVHYQFGNLGNLVHELTHISVNEAYELDFINYPVPVEDLPKDLPERDIDEATGFCKNEEARQGKIQRDADWPSTLSEELKILKAKAEAASFSDSKLKQEIVTKLDYGIQWPHREFDTVINQIMVWLCERDEWLCESDKKLGRLLPTDDFRTNLENVAENAFRRRQVRNLSGRG
ncbi:MAG: hypothetical protein FWC84_06730 [Alphaproteobacteria bacterium]|nr:hypothetical protein [Alphaproteobacteria bacterium]